MAKISVVLSKDFFGSTYYSRWAPDNTGAGFLITPSGRYGSYVGNGIFSDMEHRLVKAFDGDLTGACIVGTSSKEVVGGQENRIPSGESATYPALNLAGGSVRLSRQTQIPTPVEGEPGEVRWVDDGKTSALWVKTTAGWKKAQLC